MQQLSCASPFVSAGADDPAAGSPPRPGGHTRSPRGRRFDLDQTEWACAGPAFRRGAIDDMALAVAPEAPGHDGTEGAYPQADRLIRHRAAAFGEQVLNVGIARRKAERDPVVTPDHGRRKALKRSVEAASRRPPPASPHGREGDGSETVDASVQPCKVRRAGLLTLSERTSWSRTTGRLQKHRSVCGDKPAKRGDPSSHCD